MVEIPVQEITPSLTQAHKLEDWQVAPASLPVEHKALGIEEAAAARKQIESLVGNYLDALEYAEAEFSFPQPEWREKEDRPKAEKIEVLMLSSDYLTEEFESHQIEIKLTETFSLEELIGLLKGEKEPAKILDNVADPDGFWAKYLEKIQKGQISTQAATVETFKERFEREIESGREYVWALVPAPHLSGTGSNAKKAKEELVEKKPELAEKIQIVELPFASPGAEISRQIILQGTERGYSPNQIRKMIEACLDPEVIKGGSVCLTENIKGLVEGGRLVTGVAQKVARSLNERLELGLVTTLDRGGKHVKRIELATVQRLLKKEPQPRTHFDLLSSVLEKMLSDQNSLLILMPTHHTPELQEMTDNLKREHPLTHVCLMPPPRSVAALTGGGLPIGVLNQDNMMAKTREVFAMSEKGYRRYLEQFESQEKERFDYKREITSEMNLLQHEAAEFLARKRQEGTIIREETTPTNEEELCHNLLQGLAKAAETLRNKASDLDKLNLFPVPDGDTGKNIANTAQELCRLGKNSQAKSFEEIQKAWTRASLGGNSGIIMRAFVKGYLDGLGEAVKVNSLTAKERALVGTICGAQRAAGSLLEPEKGFALDLILDLAREARMTLTGEKDFPGEDTLSLFHRAILKTRRANKGIIDPLAIGFSEVYRRITEKEFSLEIDIDPYITGLATLSPQSIAKQVSAQVTQLAGELTDELLQSTTYVQNLREEKERKRKAAEEAVKRSILRPIRLKPLDKRDESETPERKGLLQGETEALEREKWEGVVTTRSFLKSITLHPLDEKDETERSKRERLSQDETERSERGRLLVRLGNGLERVLRDKIDRHLAGKEIEFLAQFSLTKKEQELLTAVMIELGATCVDTSLMKSLDKEGNLVQIHAHVPLKVLGELLRLAQETNLLTTVDKMATMFTDQPLL
jgi:hypothetical protein